MQRLWVRWVVPVLALALLGLGQSPLGPAGADPSRHTDAGGHIAVLVSVPAGWAHAGPGSRAGLGTPSLTRERPGVLADLARPAAVVGPGVFDRFDAWGGTTPSSHATPRRGRSPPAQPSR